MIEFISFGVVGGLCAAAMLYILYGFTRDSFTSPRRGQNVNAEWHRRGF